MPMFQGSTAAYGYVQSSVERGYRICSASAVSGHQMPLPQPAQVEVKQP